MTRAGSWSIGTRAQTAASLALFRVDVFSFDAADDVIAMRRRVDALIRHGDMVRSALTEPAAKGASQPTAYGPKDLPS